MWLVVERGRLASDIDIESSEDIVGSAESNLQHEDEAVRVVRWRLPPGSEIGWHRHDHDYVVVPLTDGTLTIVDAASRHAAEIRVGLSYARKAGAEHNVRNETADEIGFVEIEIKDHMRP